MIERVDVLRAAKVPDELLLQCREVAAVACEAAMVDGIDPDTYLFEPDRFLTSRHDQYSEVVREDGSRNHNQEYHGSWIAIAYDERGRVKAWGAATHNVSGGGGPDEPHDVSARARTERLVKRTLFFPIADYLQLVELYTHPDYQRQRVATRLADELTRMRHGGIPIMHMSAYYHTGIYKDGFDPGAVLRQHTFQVTGSPKIMTVGGLEGVARSRAQAPTVHGFRRSLSR